MPTADSEPRGYTRPVRWVALAAAVSALIVGGCGGSSASRESSTALPTQTSPQPAPAPTKPPRTYTKRELARLVLQPKDAPADLRYAKGESGPKTLEQIGFILPRQLKEMRAYGFRALRDAVFASRSPQSDRRVAERVWLLKNAASAHSWLLRSKDDSATLGFTQLQPAGIGDESWAANGQAQGGVVITHAFRLGNAVFVVTSYTAQGKLSPAAARAAALAALERARTV